MIAGLALIALMSVYLRSEQARMATQSLSAELKQVTERRELWKHQAAVARLRAPGVIHDRIKILDGQFEEPSAEDTQSSHQANGNKRTQLRG